MQKFNFQIRGASIKMSNEEYFLKKLKAITGCEIGETDKINDEFSTESHANAPAGWTMIDVFINENSYLVRYFQKMKDVLDR